MQNILVTGGAGYVGSHMVLALLDAGLNNITVLDDLSTGVQRAIPTGVNFIEGNVGNARLISEILTEQNIDTIFHFAGSISVPESIEKPAKYFKNNTNNTTVLARTAAQYGKKYDKDVRFIFSSTAAVYGPSEVPVQETHKLAPATPYGESKLRAEVNLFMLAKNHPRFKLGILRYFNVVGADALGRAGLWGKGESLMQFANDVAIGKAEKLKIYGTDYPTPDGTAVRDFIHVNDLVSAHVSLARKMEDAPKGSDEKFLLNVGYGEGHSVRQVAAAYTKALGEDLKTEDAPRRNGDLGSVIADISQLKAKLNWRPAYAGNLEGMVKTGLTWAQKMAKKA